MIHPITFKPESLSELLDTKENCWEMDNKIKQELDPEGMIAPGRSQPLLYCCVD